MIYVYECSECGRREEKLRTLAERDFPVHCGCVAGKEILRDRAGEIIRYTVSSGMVRVFDPGTPQICADPFRYRSENKAYPGLDATDALAQRKADDREYEANIVNLPSKPRKKPMAEIAQEMGLT